MRWSFFKVLLVLWLLSVPQFAFSSDEPNYYRYQPDAKVYILDDDGKPNEKIRNITVGERFKLMITVSVKTNFITRFFRQNGLNRIPVYIRMSNTDIYECYLTDGKGVTTNLNATPIKDSFNNEIEYQAIVYAGSKFVGTSKPAEITIECTALKKGQHPITISYGPQVNSAHTQIVNLIYDE